MARMVVRACAVSIALALSGTVVFGQARKPSARAAEPDLIAQQNIRIVSLLEQLADQARASDNLAFAVRAQSRAAKLLWGQDRDRARAIYRRAFQSLASGTATKSRDAADNSESSKPSGIRLSSITEKRQLRTDLLNQIAARDSELAEDLARNLDDSSEPSRTSCLESASGDCSSNLALSRAPVGLPMIKTREDAERCELLMSAALQVVDRDPQQAMAFAQMSVALGLSANLARLLTLMRPVDAERADLLFANAMARLERSSQVDLSEIHTLGSYLVSVVNSGWKQPISKPLVIRFMDFAFDQIMHGDQSKGISRRDDSATLYFIGRQLTDLSARYSPYRVDQLQRYVNDQSDVGAYDAVVEPGAMKVRGPSDISRDAIETTDPVERDSLYARAALAWLSQGDLREAQTSSLKIVDAATRDRVLVQIARRHSSEKRIEDAVSLTRRITDELARVELLVMLGNVARGANDNSRAAELLNEAGTCSLKAKPSLERSRSLVMIASSFSGFDTARSFEVLQSAVKAINDMTRQTEDAKDDASAPSTRAKPTQPLTLDDTLAASFETTLAALAKADFDGALALARQLPGDEVSVIAQLAVCGGGLAEIRSREQTTSGDDEYSMLSH